jgi:hypothetical protein
VDHRLEAYATLGYIIVRSSLETRPVPHLVYGILVAVSLASVLGRIAIVKSNDRRTPFLSANDRSRWCTISALVDHGTYQIDQVIKRRGWDTIDKVKHDRAGGPEHFYSSKPPLLPTLLAAEYWTIRRIAGVTLERNPFYVGRIMLVLSNVVPLILFFLLLIKLVEDLGTTDFGRLFVVAVACWGTFLTTFAVTINNHLPAAISVLAAIFAVHRTMRNPKGGSNLFVLAGLSAAFAAANELPALSFLVCVTGVMFWLSPWKTALGYLPAALLIGAAAIGTNYLAHRTIQPAYAHRTADDNWYDYEGSYWIGERKGVDRGEPSRWVYAGHVLVGHYGIFSLTPVWLLSFAGTAIWLKQRDAFMRGLAALNLLLTTVCVTFYILRPEIDRNYGGVSCGFRWMFWFIPIWLLTLIPMVDEIGHSRRGRIVALMLLAVSTFSAIYGSANPWVSPWIYEYWRSLGWMGQ